MKKEKSDTHYGSNAVFFNLICFGPQTFLKIIPGEGIKAESTTSDQNPIKAIGVHYFSTIKMLKTYTVNNVVHFGCIFTLRAAKKEKLKYNLS